MLLFDVKGDLTAPALFDSRLSRWWTYEELAETTVRLAENLVYPRKAIAFCFCQNDPASVAWYLAAVEAGHAVVLLSPGLSPDLRDRLLATYKPDFLLAVQDMNLGKSTEFTSDYLSLEGVGHSNYAWRRESEYAHLIHQDLTVLLSTSGSTGSPKLVRLSKKNVQSNAQSICEALDITPQSRAISSLPFHYSYGLSVLNTHLRMGASLVMTDESLTSIRFWDVFRQTECSSFAGVPYSYQILRRLDMGRLELPNLNVMTQAGGKLQSDLITHFHEFMAARNGRFFVMYGQTEATARISILPPHFLPEKLGSVGLSIPGGTLALEIDGTLTTEANQRGELVYSGPNVMMGYATSAEDFGLGDQLCGTLHTGDLARFDRDGFTYIEGRMKRDAKIFGLRVSLDEVEDLLRVHGHTAVVAAKEKLLIFCEYGDAEEFGRMRRSLQPALRYIIVHFSSSGWNGSR